jgi:excisionase family DNA binding protein
MSRAVLAPRRRNPAEAVTYDTKDMASMLKLSERTITRLAAAKAIPGLVRIGRNVRWNRRVVDEWLRSRSEAGE